MAALKNQIRLTRDLLKVIKSFSFLKTDTLLPQAPQYCAERKSVQTWFELRFAASLTARNRVHFMFRRAYAKFDTFLRQQKRIIGNGPACREKQSHR